MEVWLRQDPQPPPQQHLHTRAPARGPRPGPPPPLHPLLRPSNAQAWPQPSPQQRMHPPTHPPAQVSLPVRGTAPWPPLPPLSCASPARCLCNAAEWSVLPAACVPSLMGRPGGGDATRRGLRAEGRGARGTAEAASSHSPHTLRPPHDCTPQSPALTSAHADMPAVPPATSRRATSPAARGPCEGKARFHCRGVTRGWAGQVFQGA